MLFVQVGENYILRKDNMVVSTDIIHGKLSDLYDSLSNVEVATVYTDQHTRTFEIKIGEIVSMPREKM